MTFRRSAPATIIVAVAIVIANRRFDANVTAAMTMATATMMAAGALRRNVMPFPLSRWAGNAMRTGAGE